jgi:[CysO sulfur-carrier protein]-thiocarboxylate-dependent cysteine synthase
MPTPGSASTPAPVPAPASPLAAGAAGLVGNTPLVALGRVAPELNVRLFAKLEGGNPTGSVKDRIVLRMFERAHASGALAPGQTVVEASTGNTGLAAAMFGRMFGHPVDICVPESVYPEIGTLLAGYGATIRWIPRQAGIKSALEAAAQIARDEGAYFLNQFGNEENVRTHYDTTALEILAALPRVDAFVAGIGTGGTITGVGRRLKEANPACRVVGVEPRLGVHVQGLTSLDAGFIPPLLDESLLDAKLLVGNRHAVSRARLLLNREGLFVGISSGAVMHAALRVASRLGTGNVVMMFADGGFKYLGTELWSAPDPGADHLPDDPLDDVLWW